MSKKASDITILTQDERGILYYPDGTIVRGEYRIGKIQTIILPNPQLRKENVLEEIINNHSQLVRWDANAILISDWNPDTQFQREERKNCSCYAVQFYNIPLRY